ncbi:MAG: hypothetical protein AAGA55_06045 [Planctomycetota bacterium]
MDWWTPSQAGLIGGLLGGVGGGVLIGAIGGGVCGPLAGRGIARGFVLTYAASIAIVCVGILIAGFYAVIVGQPWHVWFPLVQIGVLGTLFGVGGRVMFARVYAKHEQRILAAEEFRRG